MMAQTPRKTFANGKGPTQSTTKGCCCKRSQCIKNYCDCYQSMMVCTQLCRCIGCRNTEERMAVEPRTASRNSNAIKRDRAAAMSAKAAAAMNAKAEAAMNVKAEAAMNAKAAVMPPISIIRVAPDTFNVVLQQDSNEQMSPLKAKETNEIPTTSDEAKQSPDVEAKGMEPPDTELNETHNLFAPIINEAQLSCSLIQGSEAEQLGLNPSQVGRLVIAEFTNCFKEVCEKMLNM